MSLVLMGVLRMPPDMWLNEPIDIAQRYIRYLEAADRIEKLEQFIRNGVTLGYIAVPGFGDPALDIIKEILNS